MQWFITQTREGCNHVIQIITNNFDNIISLSRLINNGDK